MTTPALSREADGFLPGYPPAGELAQHCEAMCRFGVDRSGLLKVVRSHGMAGRETSDQMEPHRGHGGA